MVSHVRRWAADCRHGRSRALVSHNDGDLYRWRTKCLGSLRLVGRRSDSPPSVLARRSHHHHRDLRVARTPILAHASVLPRQLKHFLARQFRNLPCHRPSASSWLTASVGQAFKRCGLTIRSSRDRFAAAELFGTLSQRRGRKALRLNSGVRLSWREALRNFFRKSGWAMVQSLEPPSPASLQADSRSVLVKLRRPCLHLQPVGSWANLALTIRPSRRRFAARLNSGVSCQCTQ